MKSEGTETFKSRETKINSLIVERIFEVTKVNQVALVTTLNVVITVTKVTIVTGVTVITIASLATVSNLLKSKETKILTTN